MDDLLTACSSSEQLEFEVIGNSWSEIHLYAKMSSNSDPEWGKLVENKTSATSITISKSTLQSWKDSGCNQIYMQNPASSVKVRPI